MNRAGALAALGVAGLAISPVGASVKSEGESPAAGIVELFAYPPLVRFDHASEQPRLLVQGVRADGITVDLTSVAEIEFVGSTPAEDAADEHGRSVSWDAERLRATGAGSGELRVRVGELECRVSVALLDTTSPPSVSFRRDVMPVLTKAGCNTGTCHGSARGQDGFGLSLFGFDPAQDHHRITRQQGSRRLQLAVPSASLLLEKATGSVAHTGGERFSAESPFYRTLETWIANGAPDDAADVVLPIGIEVHPREVVLTGAGSRHDLLVVAQFADGSDRDVTETTVFLSNNENSVTVDATGGLTAHEPGEAFVLARYATFTEGVSVLVVPPEAPLARADYPSFGAIDERIADKLFQAAVEPSRRLR